MKFDTVFIANRGEIACRIASTLRSLGIRSVAPFTPPDAESLHVQTVDVAVPVESYLDGEALIKLALENGAQALHPGYGFLAENIGFARAGYNNPGALTQSVAQLANHRQTQY